MLDMMQLKPFDQSPLVGIPKDSIILPKMMDHMPSSVLMVLHPTPCGISLTLLYEAAKVLQQNKAALEAKYTLRIYHSFSPCQL